MKCPKCDGKGYIQVYAHVARGVCFQCNGKGIVSKSGKQIKSVKLSQITNCFMGFTKREMKELIDNSWHMLGIEFFETKQANSMYDKFAACGIYYKISLGSKVRYYPVNRYADYRSLYDLSL